MKPSSIVVEPQGPLRLYGQSDPDRVPHALENPEN